MCLLIMAAVTNRGYSADSANHEPGQQLLQLVSRICLTCCPKAWSAAGSDHPFLEGATQVTSIAPVRLIAAQPGGRSSDHVPASITQAMRTRRAALSDAAPGATPDVRSYRLLTLGCRSSPSASSRHPVATVRGPVVGTPSRTRASARTGSLKRRRRRRAGSPPGQSRRSTRAPPSQAAELAHQARKGRR
jgi:hypothetical protein